MIARYNRLSFVFGVPGLALQLAAFAYPQRSATDDFAPLATASGWILFLIGLAFYAKAKGRTGWWGLLGVFSILGFIVLGLLPDRARGGFITPARGWAVATAQHVGAPPIFPGQGLAPLAEVNVSVGKDDVVVSCDGASGAVLPRHSAGFLEKLAEAGPFTASSATAWEPAYAPEDVFAILAILVRVGVLAPHA